MVDTLDRLYSRMGVGEGCGEEVSIGDIGLGGREGGLEEVAKLRSFGQDRGVVERGTSGHLPWVLSENYNNRIN